MIKTYYKTATLIANSLRGVCTIGNKEVHSDVAFNIGLHLGIINIEIGGWHFN
jgi:geranylgeranyl pyrophosphate synthase